MLLDGQFGDTRIVEVYERIAMYKFRGDNAFRVTPTSGELPVLYHVAQREIDRYKTHDGRVYTYQETVTRRQYFWLGVGLMAVSLMGILWVLLG